MEGYRHIRKSRLSDSADSSGTREFTIPAKHHPFHKSNQLFDIPWTGETEKMEPGRVNKGGWEQRKQEQEQVIKREGRGSRELRGR
jgi:hypothetical protein